MDSLEFQEQERERETQFKLKELELREKELTTQLKLYKLESCPASSPPTSATVTTVGLGFKQTYYSTLVSPFPREKSGQALYSL